MSSGTVVSRKQVVTAMTASVLGWSLDLFDLFIILFVAPTVAQLFFKTANPVLSLAAVYASFAVTLFMRPIGAGIFGAYADKRGRKRAMIIAVGGVGVATALMGALPTLNQVGVLAPVLFILMRLVLGVFVGGVVVSTHTIGTETVSPRWRGTMGGLISGGGSGLGSLIAAFVLYVISSIFPGPAFAGWGWRCMFFSGLLSAVLAIFLFSCLEESPLWVDMKVKEGRPPKAPVRVVFSGKYLPIGINNLLIVIGASTLYYLTCGYLPVFLGVINKMPRPEIGKIMIWASCAMVVATLLFGAISDSIGRRKAFLLVGVINLICIPLAYRALTATTSHGLIIFYAIVLCFLGTALCGPLIAFLNERFPTAIRASGTGLSWNIGFAIGGTMPSLVTAASPTMRDIPLRLVIFLVAAIVIAFIGSLRAPEASGFIEEAVGALEKQRSAASQ